MKPAGNDPSTSNVEKLFAGTLGDAAERVAFRRSARLIHALEKSKASYQSLEMRVRRWTHNRTIPTYLMKLGDKDPILAKLLRATLIGGATFAALRWLNGTHPDVVHAVVNKMLPDFLQKATNDMPALLPGIGSLAAMAKSGDISKWSLEKLIKAPRILDYLRYRRELRKVDNIQWFTTHIGRIHEKPFQNYEEVHGFCKDVVRKVHPSQQTQLMQEAVEGSYQIDFWAKDLAARIAEAVAKADHEITLKEATSEALRNAPWSAMELTDLKISPKSDNPTAYGATFECAYSEKPEFYRSTVSDDFWNGLNKKSQAPEAKHIEQRIAGLAARFENAMSRNEIASNLLSGSGAAAAITVTAMGGLALLGSQYGSAQAAGAFLHHYMSVAPSVMTGALTVQAPLRIAQMFDNLQLLGLQLRNRVEHERAHLLTGANWNDPMTKWSLDKQRKFAAEKLESWHRVREHGKALYATEETARVAHDLTVERLLNDALKYKLERPGETLETLIAGLVARRGLQSEGSLQSLERSESRPPPIPLRPASKERVQEFLANQNAPAKPRRWLSL